MSSIPELLFGNYFGLHCRDYKCDYYINNHHWNPRYCSRVSILLVICFTITWQLLLFLLKVTGDYNAPVRPLQSISMGFHLLLSCPTLHRLYFPGLLFLLGEVSDLLTWLSLCCCQDDRWLGYTPPGCWRGRCPRSCCRRRLPKRPFPPDLTDTTQ